MKIEDSIEVLINYVQQKPSAGVNLGKAFQYGKAPTLFLPDKPTKQNNHSDIKFKMEVLKWKGNDNTVFWRIRNIE